MKLTLFIIISFCSTIVIGQKRYTVIYNDGEKLLINDSVSYQYNFKFFGKRKPPLGKHFLMHSTFKNIETKEVLSQSQPYQQRNYLIIDTLPDLHWQLENESKMILNHKCLKATCKLFGNDYIAWYAPDIAIPFGPDVFYGLPGLILEISNAKYNSFNTAITFTNGSEQFVRPTSGKQVSAVEFKKILERLRRN